MPKARKATKIADRRKTAFALTKNPEKYVKTRFHSLEERHPKLFKQLIGIAGDHHLNRLEKYRHMRNAFALALQEAKKGSPEKHTLEHFLREVSGKITRWPKTEKPLLDRRSHRRGRTNQ